MGVQHAGFLDVEFPEYGLDELRVVRGGCVQVLVRGGEGGTGSVSPWYWIWVKSIL